MFNRLGDLNTVDAYKLPKASSRIMYWGGAEAAQSAGSTQTQGANNAALMQMLMLNQAAGYMKPWRQAGEGALKQIAGLLGLPGYTVLDPTSVLKATPGYDFLQKQGVEALDRSAAARGGLFSGAHGKGVTGYGQDLALTKAWGPYMSALGSLDMQGLQAAGRTGDWTMTAGTNVAQDIMAAHQAQAQAEMAAANARNQDWGQAIQLGGLALGAAGLPFGGLGNMFSSFGNWAGMGGMSLGEMSSAGAGSYNAFAPSYFGGWKMLADGGYADRGRPHIVGERGPEVFIPRTDGVVVPNHLTNYSAFSSGILPWEGPPPRFILPPGGF